MTELALHAAARVDTGLRAYSALLPLGLRELDAAIEREAAENPWLEVISRPLASANDDALRAVAAPGPSLVAHLETQLAARDLAPDVLRAARVVAGLLDDDGYLRAGIAAVAGVARVGEAAALAGLAAVQRLDPTGVAARSLGERFRLQLAAGGRAESLAWRVAGELEALAAEGPRAFAAARDLGPRDVAAAVDELRDCDPDPTRDFGGRIDRICPDLVFAREDDRITARIESRLWPEVRLASLGVTRGLSEPMRRARSRARLTIDALARRRTTLERLAIAFLARQGPFLSGSGDPRDLLPLSGRELAREIGCAESTISRAVSSRYALTPFGVVPLRAFLARRPGSIDLTTAAVKERVREIVLASPASTDEAVMRTLRLRGIRLARRTVAKYRRELGLPTMRERSRA